MGADTVTKPKHDSRPCFLETVSSGPMKQAAMEPKGSEVTREDFQGWGCEVFVQGLEG